MPGCKKRRRLQVHHIDRYADNPYQRYDPDNGITLCFDCHKSIYNKEVFYQDLFRGIVLQNKK